MNNLDTKILNIFRALINSGTKYLTDIRYTGRFIYNIEGKEIVLTISRVNYIESNSYTTINDFNYTFYCCPGGEITEKLNFIITIKDKNYKVPELGRVEYAETLDRIDNIMAEVESKNLNSIELALNVEENEEF